MSQRSLLESVSTWSAEQRKHQLDQALPKLIEYFHQDGHDQANAKDILQVVCHSFVEVIPIVDLENVLFSKICLRVQQMFDSLLDSVSDLIIHNTPHSQDEEMAGRLAALLQASLDVIGCVEACLLPCLNAEEDVEMCHVHSLPPLILHVIKGSYSHCKDSSQIYGHLLDLVTEQLSLLFKRVHSLQMSLVTLMDKVALTSSSEQDSEDLTRVLHGFHDISVIAAGLDIKIMVTLWKTICRLCCQHKGVLFNRLDVDAMLTSLCEDMAASYSYLCQQLLQGDDKAFGKTIKVLGFQMKVLVTMVKEYESCLCDSVPSLVRLVFLIQRYQTPSLESRDIAGAHREQAMKHLGSGTEPLVACLVSNHTFLLCLTRTTHPGKFADWLPLCLTLVRALDLLPTHPEETQDRWIAPVLYPEDEPRLPVMRAVFSCLPQCHVELCAPVVLPGVMCSGKPQREVSLYEHVCTRVCAFVACHPAKSFSFLEESLLENVLSRNEHQAALAIDVWCFLDRYGSAELCRDHCHLVASLLTTSQLSASLECCHLVVLLRRLVKFLAAEHQEAFLKQYPVTGANGMFLYSVLPLSGLSERLLPSLVDSLVNACVQCLVHWLSAPSSQTPTLVIGTVSVGLSGEHLSAPSSQTPTLVISTNTAMRLLHNICSTDNLAGQHISSTQNNLILDKALALLHSLTPPEVTQYAILQHLMTSTLDLLTFFTANMETSQILKLLQLMIRLLGQPHLGPGLKIAMCSCLKRLSRKVFPPSNQQMLVFGTLSKLFSQLLGDSNPVVQQVSLEAFAQFAEETVHESVVPESLQANEDVQGDVVTYLNQLANGHVSLDPNLQELRLQQECLSKYQVAPPEQLYLAADWPDPAPLGAEERPTSACDDVPPQPSKRARLDCSEQSEVMRTALTQLKVGLATLRSAGPASVAAHETALVELTDIHRELATYL